MNPAADPQGRLGGGEGKGGAARDEENLLPHLIDGCHAYATVGEMVERLRGQWGDFQEPIRL